MILDQSGLFENICFLKLLKSIEVALFQQNFVVAAYFKHEKQF